MFGSSESHGVTAAGDAVKNPDVKSPLRPFHFTFSLDSKLPGRCFKLYEESFPGYRTSFCLPLTSERLCRRLLVSESTTTTEGVQPVPALWSLILPLRSSGVNGTRWEYHTRLMANRIYNYVVYQVGIGGAGVLLYADRMTRAGLDRVPRIAALMAKGRLVVVAWDMAERSPLGYKYDQALVASHALLGLSSCGPGVMLLLAGINDYLYSAFGHGWPSIHACLIRDDPRVTVFRIQRIAVTTSRMDPHREAVWWALPARSLARHPIMAYDMMGREPMRPDLARVLAAPAGRVVDIYAYDGLAMYDTDKLASAGCGFLLHVANYWWPHSGAVLAATGGVGGGGGVGGMDSFESLFHSDESEFGEAGRGRAGGGGDNADGGGLGGDTDANYTRFKMWPAWATNSTPQGEGSGAMTLPGLLATGSEVGRTHSGGALRHDGGDGGDIDGNVGGSNGHQGGGRSAVGGDGGDGNAAVTGGLDVGGGGAAAAAAAAAAALAAAQSAAAAMGSEATGGGGSDSYAGSLIGSGSADDSADGGTEIAADADRWAALAADKAKEARAAEAAAAEAAATGSGGGNANTGLNEAGAAGMGATDEGATATAAAPAAVKNAE
ncbi:hypothetical protein VOLCADRAFT_108141 [Volvox carteri f. nagariensis]|uniref:Uncharacterized protein n=1 Tax=Volvox carteri f. nagariensis TaxID=3068 RepID=D8UII0_VOLCA|nr:uncharacterized protein VOLCADRAFT_108141 [Volvox carteri f. nagariensis]EFJ40478.1 hypothetical protein VOLCADRAFT_108141 [Volvox carteri f. nagariensis]|eukprot:XP_002958478.1 hypothetical protein VOLCADRAFT_108141 [Volvox carteri f. nagariensis]